MTQWVPVSIDLPARTAGHGTEPDEFWSTALGWPLGEPWRRHRELCTVQPPIGDGYVHRQRVIGPAGVHIATDNSPDEP